MVKYLFPTKIVLGLSVFLMVSCNTYFWQPVCQLVEGTWVSSPNPNRNGFTEKWHFEAGGCLTITLHDPNTDTPVDTLEYITDRTVTDLTTCIEWSCKSQFTKHYVQTDRWFLGGDPDITAADIGQWLVVKVNKEELYLSAEVENSQGQIIKGGIQRGFLRGN